MFLRIKTKRLGWSCAVAVSALQKGCRRCNPDLTFTAASELIFTGYAGAVWKRMIVISCEDVGPANPTLVERVMKNWDKFNRTMKEEGIKMKEVSESPKCIDVLFTALLEVVSSPKSRITDNACYVWLKDLDLYKLLKASGNDKTTKVENILKYGMSNNIHKRLEAFVCLFHMIKKKNEESSRLDSDTHVRDAIKAVITEYERKIGEYKGKGRFSPRARLWNKIFVKCDNVLAYTTLAFSKMMSGDKILTTEIKALDLKVDFKKYMSMDWKYDLPEYVYDKHTVEGARKGHGMLHFFGEPSLLNNRAFEDIEKHYYDLALKYRLNEERKYGKLGSTRGLRLRIRLKYQTVEVDDGTVGVVENVPSDLKVFTKQYRPQIITAGYKPIVYFAEYEGKIVVVKGPYIKKRTPDDTIKADEYKGIFGLKRCNPREIKLVPDYVSIQEDVLAIANYVDQLTVPQTFLIFDSLVDIPDNPKTFAKTSKKMDKKEVLILDMSNIKIKHLDLIKQGQLFINTDLGFELMKVLLFRWVMEINDTCNRNILIDIDNNKVYSVDEESIFGGQRKYYFKITKRGKSRKIMTSIIEKNKKKLLNMLKEWKTLVDNEKLLKNIDLLLSGDLTKWI